jgi:hypothetical protein
VGVASNREGVGAQLRLNAGQLWEYREIRRGGSYMSCHDVRAHFGLGANRVVDDLDILWPSL